ncbi:MAG: tRNA 2-thiocytidine(32) synthetase TtcA [Clostridia bacterium]|nr:tRNA 2-thiocytidine(32) synthetase TtcA [Clostridia bacterium]
MSDTRRLLSYVRRAVDDYNMIEDGDVIAVGISGGKDSLTLLTALAGLQKFYPKHFSVRAVSIDMGLQGMDFSPVAEYCRELGVQYDIIPTEISHIIFDVRKESNPCSLCAKMRRGALNRAAVDLGCNKVALGHHFDDVVETFMLNLFFEGRIGVFSPVTYLSRMNVTVIRPLIYMPEKDVRYFASHADLPVVTSTCPADGNTEREQMKQLLARLDREHKGLRYRIFGAILRGEIDGFREISRMQGIKAYDDNEKKEEEITDTDLQ